MVCRQHYPRNTFKHELAILISIEEINLPLAKPLLFCIFSCTFDNPKPCCLMAKNHVGVRVAICAIAWLGHQVHRLIYHVLLIVLIMAQHKKYMIQKHKSTHLTKGLIRKKKLKVCLNFDNDFDFWILQMF